MAKKLVLVVDDDSDFCELLADVLIDAGYECNQAHNGAEALQQMGFEYTTSSRDHPGEEPRLPHLILLDWLMPHMDGFDFMSALQGNPKYRDIPVVVISGVALAREDRISWVAHLPKQGLSIPALLELVARKVRGGA